MSLAIGIIAATFLGGEPTKPADPAPIAYTFRVVDVPSLDWRKTHYGDLKSLGRQGASQVWTMPKSAVAALQKEAGTEAVASPRLIAAPDTKATIESYTSRQYMTDVARHVQGPIQAVTEVSYTPLPETIREGYSATITGRAIGSGVATKVALDCTWVADVREIGTPAEIRPGARCNCVATIEIPQVASSQVVGDWTIPDGMVLVISHGIQAVSGKKYPQGASIERLTIIETKKEAMPAAEVVPASFHAAVSPDAYKAKARALVEVRPTPPTPSRSLLPAIGPDGEVVELPALPDDQVAPASFANSSVPRPSPQSFATGTRTAMSLKIDPNVVTALHEPEPIGRSTLHVEPMKVDPKVATAGFEPLPIARSNIRLDGPELAAGRTQTIRVPLGGKISIELKARVVPADDPE